MAVVTAATDPAVTQALAPLYNPPDPLGDALCRSRLWQRSLGQELLERDAGARLTDVPLETSGCQPWRHFDHSDAIPR